MVIDGDGDWWSAVAGATTTATTMKPNSASRAAISPSSKDHAVPVLLTPGNLSTNGFGLQESCDLVRMAKYQNMCVTLLSYACWGWHNPTAIGSGCVQCGKFWKMPSSSNLVHSIRSCIFSHAGMPANGLAKNGRVLSATNINSGGLKGSHCCRV